MGKYVIGALLLLLIGSILYVYLKVRRTARDFSKAVFGSESLVEGMRKQKEELSVRPKSVSSMTRVFLPQIERDFPEFNWLEFKQKSENMLRGFLSAIDSQDIEKLRDASPDLRRQTELRIEELMDGGRQESYENVRIHQTEIARYRKEQGTCVIVVQSAVEYLHYIMEDGILKEGSQEFKEQVKYNLELQYVQDVSGLAEASAAVGITCPQCGAPVTKLGSKFCEYCGTAVEVINIRVWSINKIYEV